MCARKGSDEPKAIVEASESATVSGVLGNRFRGLNGYGPKSSILGNCSYARKRTLNKLLRTVQRRPVQYGILPKLCMAVFHADDRQQFHGVAFVSQLRLAVKSRSDLFHGLVGLRSCSVFMFNLCSS